MHDQYLKQYAPAISQEWNWSLSWNFQGMLRCLLNKLYYACATTTTTITATSEAYCIKVGVSGNLKVLMSFIEVPKNWRATRPPLTLFFPKVTVSKFWNSYIAEHSRIPNKCVFEDDLIPQSPRGKGCKLWTMRIVYI